VVASRAWRLAEDRTRFDEETLELRSDPIGKS